MRSSFFLRSLDLAILHRLKPKIYNQNYIYIQFSFRNCHCCNW